MACRARVPEFTTCRQVEAEKEKERKEEKEEEEEEEEELGEGQVPAGWECYSKPSGPIGSAAD